MHHGAVQWQKSRHGKGREAAPATKAPVDRADRNPRFLGNGLYRDMFEIALLQQAFQRIQEFFLGLLETLLAGMKDRIHG